MKDNHERPAKIRLVDLAEMAGLSVGAASMALGKDPSIPAVTRKRVRDLACKHGYRPNQQARNLRLQKTNRIAMILPDLNNPVYMDRLRTARNAFWKAGYEVAFSCTDWDFDTERAVCEYFLAQQVDAVIFAAPSHERSIENAATCVAAGKPTCFIAGTSDTAPGLTVIRSKLEDGFFAATRLLLEHGHRRFGLVGISEKPCPRWEGIRNALEDGGLDISRQALLPITNYGHFAKDARAAMKRFLGKHGRASLPTALLASNDYAAAGAITALHDAGLRVPDDVSVVGCDNIEIGEYFSPPLTTISFLMDRLGRLAARVLQEQIRAGKPTSLYIEHDMELVVRKSTGPAPGAPSKK